MVFNSLHFFLFFPVVLLFYYGIPSLAWRRVFLLAASYYFYMAWKAEYVILLLLSTFIDYQAGIFMSRTQDLRKKKLFLITSLMSNFGLLFTFKYFNFFNDSLRTVLEHWNIFYGMHGLNILLPVGISFYTFQSVSYAIDVYRGVQKPERNFFTFALYVSFFPQLVAGPIERSTHLLPQFYEKFHFSYANMAEGLRFILWGLFKKIVVADRLALYVESVYGKNYELFSPASYLIATYFFAFQIYCDFSGYSDIARGSAKMMGFDLMENFRLPYFSKTLGEFWKRWHVSLTTWFQDYVYIPLGGNRVSKSRWYFNLFLVFLISGLWHGANWTFLFWGALNGFYLISALWTSDFRKQVAEKLRLVQFPRLHRILQALITFHLVCLGWIYFRSETVAQAHDMMRGIFLGLDFRYMNIPETTHFVYGLWAILVLLVFEFLNRKTFPRPWFAAIPTAPRWGLYFFLTLQILAIGVLDGGQFIYFQF